MECSQGTGRFPGAFLYPYAMQYQEEGRDRWQIGLNCQRQMC